MLRSFRNLTTLGVKGQLTQRQGPHRTRRWTVRPRMRERCTAEEMRYQRYQFKERRSALMIRDITLCFVLVVGSRESSRRRGGRLECVRGGCVEGDQDICAGFEEVSHGTGTILNPPSLACKRGFGPLLSLHPHPQQ